MMNSWFFFFAEGGTISYDYNTMFFVRKGAPIAFLSWVLVPDSERFPHKYSEINNNFVFKINVFQNICNRTMLFVKTRLLTFSIMFKKIILNYYYNHIINMNHIFSYDQICNMIMIYFEKIKYRRIILNK